MQEADFRSQFPVLAKLAYLNAGTDGPLPSSATAAAAAELARQLGEGRSIEHFERRHALSQELRAAYATVLGCDPEDVSLTTCTTEGIAVVIEGLGLRPGDEILTSDEEHPGLLGALAAAKQIGGVSVRVAPFAEIAEHVRSQTTLVACSHVSWMTGRACPASLARIDVPLLLDGAQGLGAVPVDLRALGADAYSAAGQKWLCGPDGTGVLYTSPALRQRLSARRRGYGNLRDAENGIDATVHEDGRRFDTLALSAETLACALAACETLTASGWPAIHARSQALSQRLCEMLSEAGREVVSGSAGPLISFDSEDPPAERASLAEQGVILRDIPGRKWLRASVGAWNDEGDLQRVVAGLRR